MGTKTIRVTVSEDRFEKLKDAKGSRTWKEAFLEEMTGYPGESA